MAIKNKKTAVAIIGGGLAGLTAAAYLEREGRDYLLIEAQNEWGGQTRGHKEKNMWLDYGLKSIPVGAELAENPLLKIKNDLGLNIQIESWNETPKTWESKSGDRSGFIDFMGFGEAKDRQLVEELSYYTQTPRLMVSGGWQNLLDELLKIIPEDKRMPQAHVTKFDVSEDTVTAAHINGEIVLTADTFVFTLSPLFLREMLPQGAINTKILQRIARTTPFHVISLDITTDKKITDAKNLFVFQEAPKEKNQDPFFVIGQFISNVDAMRNPPASQNSTWMAFANDETLEDDESGSKAIKTMKKLIKKVFPALVDGKNWERLLVVPQAIGQFESLQLEKNHTLPGLTNFYVCGGRVQSTWRNVGAALESARLTAQTVCGETSATQTRAASAETKAEITETTEEVSVEATVEQTEAQI